MDIFEWRSQEKEKDEVKFFRDMDYDNLLKQSFGEPVKAKITEEEYY